jgi:hypothetical protein
MATLLPNQTTAASAIGEHLSTPPALTRVPLLRQRIQKERTQLQQTLAQRAKEQVDLVKQGLTGLRDASFNFPPSPSSSPLFTELTLCDDEITGTK